jgi:hypothetical protein
MGSTAITGELIWPSQNDLYGANVGGAAGDGIMHYERQYRKAVGSVAGRNNYVISGGALPATDPDLTIQIPTGKAIIEGHYCEWPATDITLPASNTSHIFVKLVFSGTLITGLEIEDNTSDAPPASSTKLGTATTSGSAVTSTTDTRILGPGAVRVLTSGSTYTWPAGVHRIYVEVFGASGGGGGGGEAGSSGGPSDGSHGSAGGAGGTTAFGALTANGGSAGPAGSGGFAEYSGQSAMSGADGTASGGDVNTTGGGRPGGSGGYGGGAGTGGTGGRGGDGGRGGYASGYLSGTPGGTTSYSIGAAGTSGAGGTGGAGSDGAAGNAGKAGEIYVHF